MLRRGEARRPSWASAAIPTVPPVLAAALLGVPTVIHEQNGVHGPRQPDAGAAACASIATGFPERARASGRALPAKLRLTGNPVRPAVLGRPRDSPIAPLAADGPLRLLVFGGSQGARVMSDIVPARHRAPAAPRCARGSPSCSRPATRTWTRVRGVYAAARRAGRGRALLRRHAGAHRRRRTWWSRARARRRWRNSPSSGGPSILVPLPQSLDRTRPPMPRTLAAIGRRDRHPAAGIHARNAWPTRSRASSGSRQV